MDERRARLEKFFGDIVPSGSIEAYLYEGLPSVENEYLNMAIERPHRRVTEKDGIEYDRREVKDALNAIREEMSFRA